MAGDVYNSNGNGRSPNTAYRGQRDYSVMPRSPSEALEPERAPEPPQGSRQGRQRPVVVFFNRLLTFLLVLLPTVAGLFFLIRQQFDRPGPISYPTVFVVAKGEGVSTIARRLEQDGIINSDSLLPGRWIFLIASRRFGVHDKIKAGEFQYQSECKRPRYSGYARRREVDPLQHLHSGRVDQLSDRGAHEGQRGSGWRCCRGSS